LPSSEPARLETKASQQLLGSHSLSRYAASSGLSAKRKRSFAPASGFSTGRCSASSHHLHISLIIAGFVEAYYYSSRALLCGVVVFILLQRHGPVFNDYADDGR
jgi:hypothetical protein